MSTTNKNEVEFIVNNTIYTLTELSEKVTIHKSITEYEVIMIPDSTDSSVILSSLNAIPNPKRICQKSGPNASYEALIFGPLITEIGDDRVKIQFEPNEPFSDYNISCSIHVYYTAMLYVLIQRGNVCSIEGYEIEEFELKDFKKQLNNSLNPNSSSPPIFETEFEAKTFGELLQKIQTFISDIESQVESTIRKYRK